jgi:hypothetical protein
MAKKKNTIPSGFEDILGNIYSNAEEGEGVTDMNALMEPSTPLVEDEIDNNEPPVNEPEDGNDTDPGKDPNAHEDNTPEPPANTTTPEPTDIEDQIDDSTEPSDAEVIEAQQVGLLFDAIGDSLGWNMDEIDEKDRPLTVDQLTQYMRDVVNENSVPKYADERIQALD